MTTSMNDKDRKALFDTSCWAFMRRRLPRLLHDAGLDPGCEGATSYTVQAVAIIDCLAMWTDIVSGVCQADVVPVLC